MGFFFFSCGNAWRVSLVLLLTLWCATSVDARIGLFSSRFEVTNQEPISSRCTSHIKGYMPMEIQATRAQYAQPSIESELRYAPSGPDPMHHHASPKRPEAP